jgi:hypothetical protein
MANEPITLELNGKPVAQLLHGGWGIRWDEIRQQMCCLNDPRDCWIAQVIWEAWRQGAAAQRDVLHDLHVVKEQAADDATAGKAAPELPVHRALQAPAQQETGLLTQR